MNGIQGPVLMRKCGWFMPQIMVGGATYILNGEWVGV